MLNQDRTFSFCYLPFHERFDDFVEAAEREMARIQARGGGLETQCHRDDLIRGTVLPWISFTGLSHVRRIGPTDSVPKVTFGRYFEAQDGTTKMPISVEAHHALVDGLDVAGLLEHIQEDFDAPALWLV